MKLLVTSGYNQSRHTLALLHRLTEEGVRVDQVLIVKAFNYKRVRAYYRQMDTREFYKKVKDRILGDVLPVEVSDEASFIKDYLRVNKIKPGAVSAFCKEHDIPYRFVKSLNKPESLELAEGFDLAVYSGGGIAGKKFLAQFSTGVLNCHAGKLPEVRGMNSGEWSVLLNIPQQNTLHFMVRKLDLGPILFWREHDYSDCRSINALRGKAIIYAVEDLVFATKKILAGDYKLVDQKEEEGRQYYVMHPILRNIADAKLQLQ